MKIYGPLAAAVLAGCNPEFEDASAVSAMECAEQVDMEAVSDHIRLVHEGASAPIVEVEGFVQDYSAEDPGTDLALEEDALYDLLGHHLVGVAWEGGVPFETAREMGSLERIGMAGSWVMDLEGRTNSALSISVERGGASSVLITDTCRSVVKIDGSFTGEIPIMSE